MSNDTEIVGAADGRIYLVKYIDMSVEWKTGSYYVVGATKLEKKDVGIEIIGYRIHKEITSFREAQEEIEATNAKVESVFFPWANIVYVKNISYTVKK